VEAGVRRETARLALLLILIAGCGRPAGPPAIVAGTPCVVCGMRVEDVRWACERRVGGDWRVYDAIECLLADSSAVGPSWLTDWDHRALHAADSLWVVRGELPSPMGGGYAAFLDRASADQVAAARHGTVARLDGFATRPGGGSR
jgi:nitrous oxide reductase accessory protein NosL